MRKRFISILIAAALVLTVLPAAALADGLGGFTRVNAYDGRFVDISGWSEQYVIAAYESNLILGISDINYDPDGTVALSQAVTVAARIHSIYNTGRADFVQTETWWHVYYDYCLANGLISPGEYDRDNLDIPATRRQVVRILAGALPERELAAVNQVEDNMIPDVPMSDRDSAVIYRFYRAGILTGMEDFSFAGDRTITRGELAAVITRMTGLVSRSPLTLTAAGAAAARYDAIAVDGKLCTIGMTEAALTGAFGQPQATAPSVYGFNWVCYHDSGYTWLLAAGVKDGRVVAFASSGSGWTSHGQRGGAAAGESSGTKSAVGGDVTWKILTDANDNNIVHGIYVHSPKLSASYTEAAVAGECQVIFDLTNAFRAMHGQKPLAWDDRAAEAGRKYCNYMGEANFFDHFGPDGSDPGSRMKAEGVKFNGWGENIIAGYPDAVGAYEGWVNSKGHRENMLTSWFTSLGVGGAYVKGSYYRYYFAQEFFAT